MAGLLNSSQAASQGSAPDQQNATGNMPDPKQGGGAETLSDPILQQVEQGVEQSVPPEYQQMYQSIVLAGMNVMFSKDTAGLVDQQLQASDDVVKNVSDGVAKLIMIVFNEAKQPPEKFIPAAGMASISLMCQALDYSEQTQGVKVDETMVADCTKATTQKVLQSFGITPDQVNQVISAGQQQGGQTPAEGAQPATAVPPPQGA